MRRTFHLFILIAATVIFTAFTPRIFAQQTCNELKAEVARLQQTITQNQTALANCSNHAGFCTPGQKSGYQQAIQIANSEITAAFNQERTACAPPPINNNFDHVTLQSMEVVQAIQNTSNSVKLVANKPTYVRICLDKNTGTRTLTAILRATRGATTVDIPSIAAITVDPSENLQTRRTNWSKTLNFAVPASMITKGSTIFTIGSLTDTSSEHKTIICDNCTNPTQVLFSNEPALVVRAVGLTYTFKPSPSAPSQTASPRAIDYTLLQSWLGRAYPVASVTFSQTTATSSNTWPFTCTQANSQLATLRATEVAAGRDSHTHYLALVSNTGGFMRGCSSGIPSTADPSTTAAAPTGPTSGGTTPVNTTGDTDSTFGDWYGGHELGHTYGRKHPGFCNGNTRDDTSYPYSNGQLSNGEDTSFAGLDTGDTTNSAPITVLWGGTNFDIMTYCNQPQWLSDYTYLAISQRLLDENPGFVENIVARPAPGGATANTIHVVATVNVTKNTGTIDFVTPLPGTVTPDLPASDALLALLDSNGKQILSKPVALRLMTDIPAGEDQPALIDAYLPYQKNAAEVDLILKGTVVAKYKSSQKAPVAVQGFKAGRLLNQLTPTASWTAQTDPVGKMTYTVEMQEPDGQWSTIAVGLTNPSLALSTEQANASTLRITATNGFISSPPVIVNLCPAQITHAAQLQSSLNDLQTRKASKAEIDKAKADLTTATTQLTTCQKPK